MLVILQRRCVMMRKAFTLVELLVVIFIIGLLMAIILPAVQAAREAARLAKCINNQKQIATALQHYEMSQRVLPGWREFINVTAMDPTSNDTFEIAAHASWVFSILPYKEQTDLYDRLRTGDVISSALSGVDPQIPSIAILHCPSHTDTATGRATSYVVNGGAVDDCSDTDGYVTFDISIANGPFLDRAAIFAAVTIDQNNPGWARYTQGGWVLPRSDLRRHQHTATRLSDITKMDGTAHTLMTAENAQRGFWISEELYHFYHTPDGTAANVVPGDYDELPDGRLYAPIPGSVHTIEGSVAFCWPRFYYEPPGNENMRMCYPRAGLNNPSNPRQGFTGAQLSTAEPRTGFYEPLGRDPYDGARIPAYLGLFHRKTFNNWYQSARPSAFHVAVVTVSYCDGNVRRLNLQTDERVFVHLMVAGAPQSDAGWRFGGGERNFLEGQLFDGRWIE